MLSGELWPSHPHIYQGECISSWIVRCAHANGLKVQTFCDLVFSKDFQVWNRDIDRTTPEWLLRTMQQKTGETYKETQKTILKFYENRLFPTLHPASQLRWVLPLKKYHRKHQGFGMQYCPACLAEDKEPYFRLFWRLGFYTFCPEHGIMLHDRCPHCEAPISYHRVELGKPSQYEIDTLDQCWQCQKPLSDAPHVEVDIWQKCLFFQWRNILSAVQRNFVNSGPINFDRITLLHQICRLLLSKRLAPNLLNYICEKTNQPIRKPQPNRVIFEHLDVNDRHYLCGLAWWLVGKTPRKLQEAIKNGALKQHETYKDIEKEIFIYNLQKN